LCAPQSDGATCVALIAQGSLCQSRAVLITVQSHVSLALWPFVMGVSLHVLRCALCISFTPACCAVTGRAEDCVLEGAHRHRQSAAGGRRGPFGHGTCALLRT
jgi:hypothetical protein